MRLLPSALERLSLRHRFLVAPLVALLACSLATAAFVYESQRQNALLSRISERELAALDHYSALFARLLERHMALYGILFSARKLDEEDLYEQAKQHLDGIRQSVVELERALPQERRDREGHFGALRDELLTRTQAYRRAATSAVEMSTVNLAVALSQLARANDRFTAMNRSFAELLESERSALRAEIGARVRHSRISSAVAGLIGVLIAAFLLVLSVALSRILAATIERQAGILTDLGAQAGARFAVSGANEVDRISHAIAAFGYSLLELRRSRDELEQRVQERTCELRSVNDELRSEVELRKEAERQLQRLAFHDSLTGLPNRVLFQDRLNVALAGAARHDDLVAVMYLDLDHFKYVNDTLGHPAGDRLLVEVGQRVSRCLRASDTLARLGGDEFTVILDHLGAVEDARRVAERIVEEVGSAVQLGDETVFVGASIGISFFPRDGRDAESLQKKADLAMYEAKQAGRGQHRIFSPAMAADGSHPNSSHHPENPCSQ
jgi:diguanylate cyclase (GGDEF)-like protein